MASSNKHLLLAGRASKSHTACAAGIIARSRNAESFYGTKKNNTCIIYNDMRYI